MYALTKEDLLLFLLNLFKKKCPKYYNTSSSEWKIRQEYNCLSLELKKEQSSYWEVNAHLIVVINDERANKLFTTLKNRFGGLGEFDDLNKIAYDLLHNRPDEVQNMIKNERLRQLLR